jgi:8-oxo-dGTP pyrophosphatase MutT (NUDIX family)
MTDTPIRSAATIITLRNMNASPQVLMGQRGSKAAFMPNKFVFPGGAVDADDSAIPAGQAFGADLPRAAFGKITAAPHPRPSPWRPFASCGRRPG